MKKLKNCDEFFSFLKENIFPESNEEMLNTYSNTSNFTSMF
jgi:hypothetical protein